MKGLLTSHLRPGNPDFLDLPWHLPLTGWQGHCDRLEALPRGESRHPVVFVAYGDAAYALKAMMPGQAEHEYGLLREMAERGLPVVSAVGHATVETADGEASVLITRFLSHSLPYHSLFLQSSLSRYRDHLLDALAGLLVQLHLSHVYWGDCSLFNTLFLRDAGTLQAYLVDAETSQVLGTLGHGLRMNDLDLMEENVVGGLLDLVALGALPGDFPAHDLAADIRRRYDALWTEVGRVENLRPDERYKITERVRALNALGFSVGEVMLSRAEGELDRLELRVLVTDRSFNRRLLHSLTGLEVQEQQALQMINEINELRADLGHERNRSVSLSAAGFAWLEERYRPAVKEFSRLESGVEPAELYCLLLEHKWYMSEAAQQDVGFEAALTSFLDIQGNRPAQDKAPRSGLAADYGAATFPGDD